MRVGIAWECPWVPSSFGKLTLWLAAELQRLGFSVRVYCPSAPDVTLYSRYTTYRPYCDAPDLGLCPEVEVQVASSRRLAHDRDVDAYLVGGCPFGNVEAEHIRECSRTNKPVAGYFVAESDVVPPLLASWLLHVDAVAFPARATAEAFMVSRQVVEAHGDYLVVPHGIPEYYFRLDRDAVLEYALRLTEPDRAVELILESRGAGLLLGTVAKNHPRKDFGSLLAGFALAKRSIRDSRFRVLAAAVSAVGGDTWAVRYLSHALGLGEEEVVVLHRDQSTTGLSELGLLELYSMMNVFAFPTMGEGFGLPPVEAGALGLPVVLTRTPVTEEVWGSDYPLLVRSRVRVVEEGLLLHQTDYVDLAEKVVKAFAEPERYGRLARGISSRYTLREMVRGVVRLLELAVEKLGTKKPHPLERYDLTPTPDYQERVLKLLGSSLALP